MRKLVRLFLIFFLLLNFPFNLETRMTEPTSWNKVSPLNKKNKNEKEISPEKQKIISNSKEDEKATINQEKFEDRNKINDQNVSEKPRSPIAAKESFKRKLEGYGFTFSNEELDSMFERFSAENSLDKSKPYIKYKSGISCNEGNYNHLTEFSVLSKNDIVKNLKIVTIQKVFSDNSFEYHSFDFEKMLYKYLLPDQNKIQTLDIKWINSPVKYILRNNNKCIKNDGGFFLVTNDNKVKDGFTSFFYNQNLDLFVMWGEYDDNQYIIEKFIPDKVSLMKVVNFESADLTKYLSKNKKIVNNQPIPKKLGEETKNKQAFREKLKSYGFTFSDAELEIMFKKFSTKQVSEKSKQVMKKASLKKLVIQKEKEKKTKPEKEEKKIAKLEEIVIKEQKKIKRKMVVMINSIEYFSELQNLFQEIRPFIINHPQKKDLLKKDGLVGSFNISYKNFVKLDNTEQDSIYNHYKEYYNLNLLIFNDYLKSNSSLKNKNEVKSIIFNYLNEQRVDIIQKTQLNEDYLEIFMNFKKMHNNMSSDFKINLRQLKENAKLNKEIINLAGKKYLNNFDEWKEYHLSDNSKMVKFNWLHTFKYSNWYLQHLSRTHKEIIENIAKDQKSFETFFVKEKYKLDVKAEINEIKARQFEYEIKDETFKKDVRR